MDGAVSKTDHNTSCGMWERQKPKRRVPSERRSEEQEEDGREAEQVREGFYSKDSGKPLRTWKQSGRWHHLF